MMILMETMAASLALWSLWVIPSRPGFFAGVYLCSMGMAALFGSVGVPLGIPLLLVGIGAYLSSDKKLLPSEVALVAWVGLMSMSLLWSHDFTASFYEFSQMIIIDLGTYLYARANAHKSNFLWDFALAVLAINVISFFVLAHTMTSLRLGNNGNPAITPVGVAAVPEMGIVTACAFLIFKRDLTKLWKLVLIAALIGVYIPFVIGTGTRSAIASTSIVFVGYLTILSIKGRFKPVLISTLILGTLVALAYLLLPLVLGQEGSNLALHTLARLGSVAGSSTVSVDPAEMQRLDFYSQAIQMFEAAPLFGYGIAGFGQMADGLQAVGVFPHNMELELLIDGGAIGLTLFGLFLIPTSWVIVKRALTTLSWQAMTIIGLLVSTLMRHQLSMSIMAGKLLFFALGCGVAIWLADSKDARQMK